MNISDLDFVDSINIHSIAGGLSSYSGVKFATINGQRVVSASNGQSINDVSTSDVQAMNDILDQILYIFDNFQVQLNLYS